MTETMKEITRSWKLARRVQIMKLYQSGKSRAELVKRFGAQNVSDALDSVKRYC